ncbi:JlpA-like lipoprotein [Campylobacter sp. VicNov18]|uniref:JlpA family lipoprotein adhesin n=1 Tax=Campylobacter bilis TaxID=2691918 RepID=UPI00130E6D45|nr:JlpA family lipoprotein adhesin [Campylobacter bilis]MPV63853.1 hypothetical protein [Campylobacter hepaticus]MBM0637354.1 hypothetical protein [Campylobacter bilis]MCC8278073.1 JlpA-like lipoprotein [Campylobacter bilis]MCC8299577.1 JlpA-like lipoprotein [Campylobacter bilis]MCC8300982.1 JlpA-like lipoprotein [Campylobacter bilis]
MKKNIFIAITLAILLSACKNSIDQTTVNKYQNQLNQTLAQDTLSLFENSDIKIDLSDFSCKANKAFIECLSPDFKTSIKDSHGNYQELFKAKNILLQSNEIYKKQAKENTNIKQYYEHLLKEEKILQTNWFIQNFQLGKEIIHDINASLAQEDPKINAFIEKLNSDSYTLSFGHFLSKKDNDYSNSFLIKLDGAKLNLSISFDITMKEDLLNYFDTQGIKLNTTNLTNDFFTTNKNLIFNNETKKYIVLNNFKINSTLQTEGVFTEILNKVKENLQTLKIQSQNEEQALIFNKTLNVLKSMTQNNQYQFDLDLKFKNTALNEYGIEMINNIEKLNINDQDLTEVLKILFPFLMLSMLMDAPSF